ncbi:MAG: ATP-binding protein [Candidatus Bathyarchaeota archaeon]|nr:ATP-binding protein [Candidatus Bathyarchaeota archaeon]
MNIFAVLSLTASALCFVIGYSVYFLNRKELLNKLFFLAFLITSYCAFSEFMMRQAVDFETAYFWAKVGFLWPLSMTFLLHFGLVFIQSKVLKNKLTYVLLYGPAMLFALLELTTNNFSGLPVKAYWGYTYTLPQSSVLMALSNVWVAAITLLTVFLFINYHFNIAAQEKKKQAKTIAAGLSIPIVVSIITEMVFPECGILLPGFGSISSAVLGGFVAYAVWRYQLFVISPTIAADKIVSTMPDALILANLEGDIIDVNQAAVDFLGYNHGKDVIGKSINDFFEKNILSTLLKGKVIRNNEIEVIIVSGVKKEVMLSGATVKANQGEEIGVVCIIRDITEKKQMEQRLIKAEKLASIGELAGMVGHDLRNPLTSIKLSTYYLKKKYAPVMNAKGREIIENIDKSIGYSNKIINDLLEYAQTVHLKLIDANPRFLVTNTLSTINIPQYIHVTNESTEEPTVKVDVTKMKKVFFNIITNAIDAIPHKGTLRITSTALPNWVKIAFQDTGEGIPPHELGKIWEPLFTTKAKGMGFGLSISKRIVEAHNGKITVESTAGKGTTVTVWIPTNPPATTIGCTQETIQQHSRPEMD